MIKNLIVFKYLLKGNLYSFLIVFIFSSILFFSIDLIELIRRGASKEIEFIILLKLAIFHLPSLFPIILPTVFLLSSMNTYMKLNKNNELSVLRSSGFSIWILIFPAIVNTIIISFVYLFFFNPIFAYMNIKFKNYESNYFKGSSGLFSLSSTGLWLRENNDEFSFVINAQNYSSEAKTLKNVIIFKFDKIKNQFLERLDVEKIEMIDDEKWILNNGVRLEINKIPQEFKKIDLLIDLSVDKIEQNFRPPETISIWKLNDYIKDIESSGFSVKKLKIYQNYIYSYPLILIAMVLLGCLLSLRKDRIKKNIMKILLGIIIGVMYHFISDLIKTFGVTGNLNVFFAVWSPPIVLNLLLISAFIHYEDG